MQLVSLTHDDFYSLRLKDLHLQPLNLIVGKNANGKSRTMATVDHLAGGILSRKRHPLWWGQWQASFLLPSGDMLHYTIRRGNSIKNWNNYTVLYESLALNDHFLIDRRNENGVKFCRVFSEAKGRFEDFHPPIDQLVLHIRRDVEEYPTFEKLIDWGERTHSFQFSKILNKEQSPNGPNISTYGFWKPQSTEESKRLVDIYLALTEKQQHTIVSIMQEMGYSLDSIQLITFNDRENPNVQGLSFREIGFDGSLSIENLSHGMFRTISLLIYFTYLINTQQPQLILIDDLGEGLDYSRVVKLGKFIFNTCEQAGVQLIATSNDGFLMDAIPIRYWNVLQRNGTEITTLNEKNHPDLFNDFAFTGLSNFDFFSSDYIDSKLK